MNRTDIINIVAEKTGLTLKQAEDAVKTTFDAMQEALADDEKVLIVGFGTFTPKTLPARKGHNPSTGAVIDIAPSKTLTFKIGKDLHDKMNS